MAATKSLVGSNRTSRQEVQATFTGMPLQYDLLDMDLDSKFLDVPTKDPLSWGIAVGAVPNSWDGETTVGGIDWSATFFGPKKLKVPVAERTPSGRILWRTLGRPCALLTVRTGKNSMNEARDFGRTAVRGLLALLRREVPSLLPADILWEGVIAKVRGGRIGMTTAGTQMEIRQPATAARLVGSSMTIARVSLHKLPSHVIRALQWLDLARAAEVKADQFIHMWLAILVLATHGRVRGNDMTRIRKYVLQTGTGVGGVLSQRRIDELIRLFAKGYDARNRLMHHDDEKALSLQMLDDLERGAFELVDFELRKARMSGV